MSSVSTVYYRGFWLITNALKVLWVLLGVGDVDGVNSVGGVAGSGCVGSTEV